MKEYENKIQDDYLREYKVEKIEKIDFSKLMVDTVLSGASIGSMIGFITLCFKSSDINSMYYYLGTIGSYFIGNKFYDNFYEDLKKVYLYLKKDEEKMVK